MSLVDISVDYEWCENGCESVMIRYRFSDDYVKNTWYNFSNMNANTEAIKVWNSFIDLITNVEDKSSDDIVYFAVRNASVMYELFYEIFTLNNKSASCA
jgi:hypothetical protein